MPSIGAYNICNLSAGGIGAKARIYHELACLALLSSPEHPCLHPSSFPPSLPISSPEHLPHTALPFQLQSSDSWPSPHNHNLGIAMSSSVFFTNFSLD